MSRTERIVAWLCHNIAATLRRYPWLGKTGMWNRIQDRLPRGGQVTVQFPGGYRMILDLDDYWQRLMLAGCYERRQCRLLLSMIRTYDTFLDLGANVGYYTCAAASVVKPGRVYAFEPHPKMAAWLRASCALNPELNIQVHEVAITDHNGHGILFCPPENGWQSGEARMKSSPGWFEHIVSTVTLDQFVRTHSIHRVQLCKIDIEGSEAKALRGAEWALSSGLLESICCEITDETREEVFTFLDQFRFEAVVDLRHLQPTSVEKLPSGLANVLWLRGECAKRWGGGLGWKRWLC